MTNDEKQFLDDSRFPTPLTTFTIWICRKLQIDLPTLKELDTIQQEASEYIYRNNHR